MNSNSFKNIVMNPILFHRSLSDSKSPQISRTLLNILADFDNAVVWRISSSYIQALLSLYQSFGDCTKSTYYKWYIRHFHILQFFF